VVGLVVPAAWALVFGVLTLAWPAITLVGLTIIFGIYAMGRGVMILSASIRNRVPRRLISGAIGLLDLCAGIVALLWPGITILAFTIVVGAWAIANGVLELVAAPLLQQASCGSLGWVWSLFRSIVSVIAGVLILSRPMAGAFGLALVIGVYSLAWAVTLLALARRAHRSEHLSLRARDRATA
jgi:uncharacterized membrane protein HdeD (DUF308 family)